jgi:hypothetical protein
MTKEFSDDLSEDIPALSAHEQITLGLEIDAIEHGTTPDQEFRHRAAIHNFHVASKDRSQLSRLTRFAGWLMGRSSNIE